MDGVTIMVAVMGEFVALVVVNEGILPEPLAARPIAVLLFVQANVVPLTGPDKFVVGYGLDYDGLGRNFKEIYQLV